MILDIIIILILGLFAFIGIKRGAAKTLLTFATFFAASILSRILSPVVSGFIYSVFFKANIHSAAQNAVFGTGVEDSIEQGLRKMPDLIKNILGNDNSIKSAVSSNLSGAANVLESGAEKIIVALIEIFVIIILFFVLFFIAKFLGKIVLKVFRLPVLKQMNSLLGGVLGLLQGIIICLLIILILRVCGPLLQPPPWILSDEVIESSHLFGFVYSII